MVLITIAGNIYLRFRMMILLLTGCIERGGKEKDRLRYDV